MYGLESVMQWHIDEPIADYEAPPTGMIIDMLRRSSYTPLQIFKPDSRGKPEKSHPCNDHGVGSQ